MFHGFHLSKKIICVTFFVTSCSDQHKVNILTRNENGYEIPQDILLNKEQPGNSDTPHYFEKTSITVFMNGEKENSAMVFSKEKSEKIEKSELHCFNEKKPGIPIKIFSDDHVENTDYKITFDLKECHNLNISLSSENKFVIIKNIEYKSNSICHVIMKVSTPDNLNSISRKFSVTLSRGYPHLCDKHSHK